MRNSKKGQILTLNDDQENHNNSVNIETKQNTIQSEIIPGNSDSIQGNKKRRPRRKRICERC